MQNLSFISDKMIIFVSKLIRKGYFYNTAKAEVDFYVPDRGMAIQVSYSIADEDTRKREVNGLVALSQVLDADNLIIVTKDEELEIESEGKTVHVIPLWKWLLKSTLIASKE